MVGHGPILSVASPFSRGEKPRSQAESSRGRAAGPLEPTADRGDDAGAMAAERVPLGWTPVSVASNSQIKNMYIYIYIYIWYPPPPNVDLFMSSLVLPTTSDSAKRKNTLQLNHLNRLSLQRKGLGPTPFKPFQPFNPSLRGKVRPTTI